MPPPQDRTDAPASNGVGLAARHITRRFGDVLAVNDVSFDVRPGEFVSLLGPSGSGKTTLLMMIAGFEYPDAGELEIGGREVTHIEPNRRNIGMVFQKYALFPHMNVRENVGFPLRMRRVSRAEIARQVDAALAMVRLQGFADRRPDQLSGGQQQRVALARATVFHPPLILMDEPLGALDKKLREQMQIEIKALQRKLGATVIYVTHDQQEALAMSDRVAVMNHGVIEQMSPPRELYDRPCSIFVADFVGDTNLLAGTVVAVDDARVTLRLRDGLLASGLAAAGSLERLQPGAEATLSVRPEHVLLDLADPDTGPDTGQSSEAALPSANDAALPLQRLDEIFTGQDIVIVGSIGGTQDFRISLKVAQMPRLPATGVLPVRWRPEDALVFADRPGAG